MKTHCMICDKQFVHSDKHVKRIVNTVDEENLGTTAILDMLTPLAGICNEEGDYHVLDFDKEERRILHELGSEHKTINSTIINHIVKYDETSKVITKTKSEIHDIVIKLNKLITEQEHTQEQIKELQIHYDNIIDKCENITFSRRIELWQVEDEQPTQSEHPSNETSLQDKKEE